MPSEKKRESKGSRFLFELFIVKGHLKAFQTTLVLEILTDRKKI